MFLRIAAALLSCLAAAGVAGAACENPARLRFSLIPQADVKKDVSSFQPLLKGLERALARPVEIVTPASYGSVVEGLLAGSIDLAMMGPASYAKARRKDSDVTAFATITRKAGAFQEEGASYRALLIVRSDSRFNTLESLKGARLALVDPASTSGALLPRHMFSPLIGMPFEQYFGRVAYSGSHDKSASLVASGHLDAAFVSSFLLADFIADGKARSEDFRVVWRSEPIPLDPFVYRSRLCEPMKEKIRQVFLSKDGKAYPQVLDGLGAIRFAPVSDDNYQVIHEMLRGTP
jgi:phosphonate transport system substrate-binding protein